MSLQQTWTSSVSKFFYKPLSAFLLIVLLVGGPDRPPSKRMIEQMRADEQAQREAGRQNSYGPGPSSRQAPGRQEEGYWAYMQRQIQERTENLGLAGDSMDKVEENSQGWANDVNKYVKDQKKKAVMGCELFHFFHAANRGNSSRMGH